MESFVRMRSEQKTWMLSRQASDQFTFQPQFEAQRKCSLWQQGGWRILRDQKLNVCILEHLISMFLSPGRSNWIVSNVENMTLLQTYSLYRTKEAENWAIFSNYLTASLPEVGWNLWNYVKLCWPHFKWKFHETEFQQEWTRWRTLIQSKQLPPNLLKVSDNKSKGERENRKGRSLNWKRLLTSVLHWAAMFICMNLGCRVTWLHHLSPFSHLGDELQRLLRTEENV